MVVHPALRQQARPQGTFPPDGRAEMSPRHRGLVSLWVSVWGSLRRAWGSVQGPDVRMVLSRTRHRVPVWSSERA